MKPMTLHCSRYVLLVMIAASSILPAYNQEKLDNRAEQSLTWTEFRSEEGRFRIQLPDRPKLEVLTYETGKNSLVHNTFTVEKGAFIWLVDYTDLSPKGIDSINPAQLFNEARDQLLQDTNATLQHQRSLAIDGHPGLEIKLLIPGGEAQVRFYLVKNRLYQLAVTRLDLLSNSRKSMERFLNSFKIINSPTRTAIRSVPRTKPRLSFDLAD